MLARLARVRPRAPLVGVRPAWVHTRLCAVLQPPQPLLALLHPHLPPVLDPFSQLPAGGCDLSLPTAAEHISPLTFGGIAIGGVALELPPLLPEAATPLQAKGSKGWRTYQPNVLKRKRTHGFLNRLSTRAGRNTLNRRRAKGRHRVAVT